ncbi:FxLD family lantipeptide [Streptomyces sp. NA02950]|uniref:FxLD family lanthipeptide n=1 Tax=Streptomyces sp. NA02950 TaxID=2742137 RepID=UPI00159214C6|nr:FxLD family lanthipeptide [Streptomyces sp. NA02950]QKV90432.1 FxLD family lantipeptide [Streptomyces sp. NA02950]QKV97235.1 FxLD family lantipeptide [Streptomyces sp. NA02950]
MTTATPVRKPATEHTAVTEHGGESVDDAFVLDIHVISDVRPDLMPTACDTNDGCKKTCASACTST